MKNNLSKLTAITGTTIIICSIIRWFFFYYDPSQLVLGIGIGIIVLGFAYIYNWMKGKDEEIKEINKRIDSFVKWLGKGEMK